MPGSMLAWASRLVEDADREVVVKDGPMARGVDGWQALPVQGRRLERLVLHGNGKDCTLTVVVADDEADLVIPMRDPRIEVSVTGRLQMRSFNRDDSDLGMRYEPQEPMQITTAELEWPAEVGDWQEALDRRHRGSPDWIGYTISWVRLTLDSEGLP